MKFSLFEPTGVQTYGLPSNGQTMLGLEAEGKLVSARATPVVLTRAAMNRATVILGFNSVQ